MKPSEIYSSLQGKVLNHDCKDHIFKLLISFASLTRDERGLARFTFQEIHWFPGFPNEEDFHRAIEGWLAKDFFVTDIEILKQYLINSEGISREVVPIDYRTPPKKKAYAPNI